MIKIEVLKSFILNVDGVLKSFATGIHEVEDEISQHWYVQAHSQAVDATPAAPAAQELPEGEDAETVDAAATTQDAVDAASSAPEPEKAKKGK